MTRRRCQGRRETTSFLAANPSRFLLSLAPVIIASEIGARNHIGITAHAREQTLSCSMPMRGAAKLPRMAGRSPAFLRPWRPAHPLVPRASCNLSEASSSFMGFHWSHARIRLERRTFYYMIRRRRGILEVQTVPCLSEIAHRNNLDWRPFHPVAGPYSFPNGLTGILSIETLWPSSADSRRASSTATT